MLEYWSDAARTLYNKSCTDIGYELSEEYCRLIVDRNRQGVLAKGE